MGTLSVRLPEQMEQELHQFVKDERLEQPSEAARKLLSIGLEAWRQEKALKLLHEGKVTFTKAAKIAELSLWDFAALVREQKTIWVKDKVIQEDIMQAGP
ncbi:MAG: hypothetical protein AABX13_05125 [Nanoarchaeota archaeon]